MIDLSVVIPVFNEQDNIRILADRICAALNKTGWEYEVIFVDDGSSDSTPQFLWEIAEERPQVKCVQFTKNYGQSAAMTAGFHASKGKWIASMDGDLQNHPEDIEMMVRALDDCDLVCGWRKSRKDKWGSRKLPSQIANRLIGSLTGVKIHDYGCSLKAYRREFIHDIVLYGDLHRFIPVLLHFRGARIKELEVRHSARQFGMSKYGIGRTPKVILDLCLMLFLQSFITRPNQLFGRLGMLFILSGGAIESYLVTLKIGFGQDIGDRPLLLLGALLIICGLMLFGFGLLAEIMVRVYFETSGKQIYRIRESSSKKTSEEEKGKERSDEGSNAQL